MASEASIRIRPYRAADHSEVIALAPRLAEWVAAWRDPAAVLPAVPSWVRDSIGALGQPGHAVYVAEDGDGIAGLVTVGERTHFTGQVDAYAGELAVRAGKERRGIATRPQPLQIARIQGGRRPPDQGHSRLSDLVGGILAVHSGWSWPGASGPRRWRSRHSRYARIGFFSDFSRGSTGPIQSVGMPMTRCGSSPCLAFGAVPLGMPKTRFGS